MLGHERLIDNNRLGDEIFLRFLCKDFLTDPGDRKRIVLMPNPQPDGLASAADKADIRPAQ